MRALLWSLGLTCLLGCSPTSTDTGGASSAASGAGGDGSTDEPTPPLCIETSSCDERAEFLELIFEAPPSVELLQATTSAVLGYDNETKQYVLYALDIKFGATKLPTAFEAWRLGSEIDRAALGSGSPVGLACAGSSCDLWRFTAEGGQVAHVPDELEATVVSQSCAAGRGIACFGESANSIGWSHKLGPEALERPLIAIAPLLDEVFIASDGVGPLMRVDHGEIVRLDVGTTSPFVALRAMSWQHWMGLTAAGELVMGDASGGQRCESGVRFLVPEGMGYASGDFFNRRFVQSCARYPLPEGVIDVALVGCGSSQPMAIDARRVWTLPLGCIIR